MTPLFRRGATLAAAATLAVTTFAVASPASAADPAYDARPGTAGAAWLTTQLTDGIVHNPNFGGFDDIGLSADFAFGLAALGGQDAAVDEIADAVEPRAENEWYTSTFDGVTTLYAGSLAKALVFAQTTGREPTSFGGANLVTALESHVATAPPIAGRIEDENNSFGDSNVIGQAYAAQGLTAAGSVRAADATAFLLQQQCAEGYFRLYFTEDKTAADQSCDGGDADTSAPDTDVTALAVLALREVPGATAAMERAVTWLQSQQQGDGSFGGGTATEAPNANSTGLAGSALGSSGDTDAAEDAAVWVRQHQAVNVGECTPFVDANVGAIAYDDAALAAGRDEGITDATVDQWWRASSQALPVLRWAPAGGAAHALGGAGYVKAGSTQSLGVIGLAPGASTCAWVPATSKASLAVSNRDGEALPDVRVPRGTGVTRVQVVGEDGPIDTVSLRALGAKTLPVTLKKKVAAGAKQVVRVRGLAPGELVTVSITWPHAPGTSSGSGAGGQANRKGVFTMHEKVPNRPGKAKVAVKGEFGNRKAHRTFQVTR